MTRECNLPEVGAALRASLQPPAIATVSFSADRFSMRIPVQRVAHLQDVMQQHVPEGEWREMNLSGVSDPLDWILKCDKPAIALVSVLKPTKGLSSLLNRNATRGHKIWAAHPELRMMREISEVRVSKVYVADAYVHAEATLSEPTPRLEALDHASISSGLFAEAFLTAACSVPECVPYNPHTPLMCSPRSAWLLSHARARVMREAITLANAGVTVIGAGAHSITVLVEKRDVSSTRKIIQKSSELTLPARLVNLGKGTR
jgi:hypothetical protein